MALSISVVMNGKPSTNKEMFKLHTAAATIIRSIIRIPRYFSMLYINSLQHIYSSSITNSSEPIEMSERLSFISISLWLTCTLCLFFTLVLSYDIIRADAFKILELKENILHNERKIESLVKRLHSGRKMKVKALLSGHKYLVEDKHNNTDGNMFFTSRELHLNDTYHYEHPQSTMCRVFTDNPESLVSLITQATRNTASVDREFIDDNVLSVKFSNIQDRIRYMKKIKELATVFLIECKAPYRHHDFFAHSSVSGVELQSQHLIDPIYYGKDNVVTVIDTGLDTTHCLFNDPLSKVPYFKWNRHYKNRAIDHFSQFSHRKLKGYISLDMKDRNTDLTDSTHGHGTHTAGTVSLSGIERDCNPVNYPYIPQHKILFVDVQNNSNDTDDGGLQLPASLEKLLDTIRDTGSDIISCSFGTPNSTYYSLDSYMVDKWIYENNHISIVVSAGNDGPHYGSVGSFGDAKNVITVGASSNTYESFVNYSDFKVSNLSFDLSHIQTHSSMYSKDCMADFSSRGTFDGRMKPDIVAPGSFLLSADAVYNSRTLHRDKILYRGTSMSAPLVANFVSFVRHIVKSRENTRIPNSLVKSLLVSFSKRMEGCQQLTTVNREKKTLVFQKDHKTMTRKDYGHGLLDLKDFINGMYGWRIGTLSTFSKPFNLCLKTNIPFDNLSPFRISMVYDDPPSLPGQNGSLLVNDLDMRVLVMSKDWKLKTVLSPREDGERDNKNNVEVIDTPLNVGDVVRIEVVASGFIGSYLLEGQEFAVSWNTNMEEIECPSECHHMGFSTQCTGNNSLASILCVTDSQGFGTFGNKCEEDLFKERLLDFMSPPPSSPSPPSPSYASENENRFIIAVCGLAFVNIVFIIFILM